MTRDFGYDVVRVVGLWMILVCHILSHFSSWWAGPMHDILAQCGNSVFFILSGCLLGRTWISNGCGPYGWRFVGRRLAKLWPTFATFVVLYVVALEVCGHALSVRQIVMNVTMLSWFAKMPAAGHLWFVTAIVIFYVSLVGVSRIGRLARQHARGAVVTSLALTMGVQYVLWRCGIRQAYLLPFLYGASFLFLFGDRIRSDRRALCSAGIVLPAAVYILGGGVYQGRSSRRGAGLPCWPRWPSSS